MKNITKIIDTLERDRPRLSSAEKTALWKSVEKSQVHSIESHLHAIPSPLSITTLFKKTYIMTPLAILFALVLGGGATAYASNDARPGDLLFPIDRTIENIQLKMTTNPDKHKALVNEMTQERLDELRSIVDEEVTVSTFNDPLEVDAAYASSSTDLKIETTAFADVTVTKMELGGQKYYFENNATTYAEALVSITEEFPVLSGSQIDESLSFITEDRVSRPKDRGILSITNDGQKRINEAVSSLLSFLESASPQEVNKENLRALIDQEVTTGDSPIVVTRTKKSVQLDGGNGRVDIIIKDNGDSIAKIKNEQDEQLVISQQKDKVTITDSTVMPETSEIVTVDINNDVPNVADPVNLLDLDVEATIYTDTTVVKITFVGETIYFETDAVQADTITSSIVALFPALNVQQVLDELIVKSKNRVSRPSDSGMDNPKIDPIVPVTQQKNNKRYEDDERYEESHDDGNSKINREALEESEIESHDDENKKYFEFKNDSDQVNEGKRIGIENRNDNEEREHESDDD